MKIQAAMSETEGKRKCPIVRSQLMWVRVSSDLHVLKVQLTQKATCSDACVAYKPALRRNG